MRHTTFRQLELFEAIARHGSFTRAAEVLHLTQPSVSMQIRKLTETVGTPLFEQVGKRIVLTEAGHELVQAAREVFSILDRFDMTVAERRGLKRGRLRVAAITTASYFAPRLLGDFNRLYPAIEVSLRVTNRENVLASITERLDDLYIIGQPPDDIAVESTPFLDNPLVVIAAPDHPLAGRHTIPLAELAAQTWLMREVGSGTRKAIERLFSKHGLQIRPRLELGANEAIKQAVLAGLGISALSAQTLNLHPPGQFAILDAQSFPILRHWYIAHPAGRELSPAAAAFKRFLLGAS